MRSLRNGILRAVNALLITIPLASGCSRIDESMEHVVMPDHEGSLSADTEDIDSRYIYNQLSEGEKECYDIMKEAAAEFRDEAVFPYPIDPEAMKKLFLALYNQEEEIFWLSSIFYRPTEPTDTLRLDYRYDREQAAGMKTEIDAAVAAIMEGISEESTDYEKLRYFHDSIVTSCTFSKDTSYANTYYGVFTDGYAQCEGYAFAFDYLCSLCGIDCFTVTGTNSAGDAHAWNMVKLDGTWYNVDCTWDDPVLDPPDTQFIRHYYFLVNDADISGVTHFPDTTYFSLPICAASENYYVREGYTASDASESVSVLKKAAADALKKGRKDAAVRFTDRKAYDAAVIRLFDNKGMRDVLTYANLSSPRKILEGRYVRYLNEDELIIHISMIYD